MPALRELLGLAVLPGGGWVAAGLLGLVPITAVQVVRVLRAGLPRRRAPAVSAGR